MAFAFQIGPLPGNVYHYQSIKDLGMFTMTDAINSYCLYGIIRFYLHFLHFIFFLRDNPTIKAKCFLFSSTQSFLAVFILLILFFDL